MANIIYINGITQANYNTVGKTYSNNGTDVVINISYSQPTSVAGSTAIWVTYDEVTWFQYLLVVNPVKAAPNNDGSIMAAMGITGIRALRLYPATSGAVLNMSITEYLIPSLVLGLG